MGESERLNICTANNFYTKIIPRIHYKTVYKKTSDGWFKLKKAHFNTGFVIKHLEGHHVLGYTVHEGITQTAVIDIDAHTKQAKDTVEDRYYQVVGILGHPTFTVSSSESRGLHLYYIFNEVYYVQDIQASLSAVISHIPHIDVLPKGSCVRLPLGRGSELLCTETLERKFTHLSKYDQIHLIEQYGALYECLEDICPHIKTVRPNDCEFENINREHYRFQGSSIFNELTSVGFFLGNRYNSLIQIFNRSQDKESFISYCKDEDKKLTLYTDPSKDLIKLTPEQRIVHYDKFYESMIKHRKKDKSDTPSKDNIKSALNAYHISLVIRWCKHLHEYKSVIIPGLSKVTSKKRFILFIIKIFNEFLKQHLHRPNKTSYAIPSIFLKSLDSYYYIFWKILLKHMTSIDKEYYHGTINYRCREYSIKKFIDIFYKIIKYKEIYIKYYKYTSHNPTHNPPLIKHYYILPDIFSRFRSKREIMMDLELYMDTIQYAPGKFSRRWVRKPEEQILQPFNI